MRNLLAVSVGCQCLLLLINVLRCLVSDEEHLYDWDCTIGLRHFTTLTTFIVGILVMTATIIYAQDLYDIQPGISHYYQGSFIVTVISIVCFLLPAPAICCRETETLDLRKTFMYWLVIGIIYLVVQVIGYVPGQVCWHICSWLVQLVTMVLFTVGLFFCSWSTFTSTNDNTTSAVDMGFWTQCRDYPNSLTCCSSVMNFFTETPDWILTCRDIAAPAYALGILAFLFNTISVFVRIFRMPLLITQLCSGILLLASCIQYGISVPEKQDGDVQFGSGFNISVIVSTCLIFATIEIICSEVYMPCRNADNMDDSVDETQTDRRTIQEMLGSLRERFALRFVHGKERRGAQRVMTPSEYAA